MIAVGSLYDVNDGAVYLIDALSLSHVGRILNPIPLQGDGFGQSMASLGRDLIVGAAGTDRGGLFDTGSVYVYGDFNHGLSDLSGLAGLAQLRRLSLAGNDISDLAPLSGLSQLEYLNLADNNIQDISPLVDQFVVDDGDVEFTSSLGNDWLRNVNPAAAAFDDDYQFTDGDALISSSVGWQFTDLPDGEYDVQVTWIPGETRAPAVSYFLSGVTEPTAVTVNQRLQPNGPSFGGQLWQSLGTFEVVDGFISVFLGDESSGSVVADAMRLVRLGSQPVADGITNLSLEGNPLDPHSLDTVLPLVDNLAGVVVVTPNASRRH